MNKFAERLKSTLKTNSMQQIDLAKEIGLSKSAVNDYCRGKREPSFDILIKICKALDESADYLLGLED